MAGNYKDILARFKKDLGNTFQAQKNIVDVSQKYIGLLEGAEGGSGINYSTNEQDTGLKWIDGKSIYQITYDFNEGISLTANAWTSTDITISGTIDILSAELVSTLHEHLIGQVTPADVGGKVSIFNFRSTSPIVKYLTIRYIKLS